MRGFHVVLIYHGIAHGGIYFRMTKELLHLFDWHSLINGVSGKRPSEFVRMHSTGIRCFANLAQPGLHSTDSDALWLPRKRCKHRRILIAARF